MILTLDILKSNDELICLVDKPRWSYSHGHMPGLFAEDQYINWAQQITYNSYNQDAYIRYTILLVNSHYNL